MSVVLAGTGRSGTTWLARVINYDETWDYVFEPLNPNKQDIGELFGRRKYLRPDCDDLVLTGRLKEIFKGENRLVKTVRAHLLLPWIFENIKDCKVIYLVRHPGAVAWSWTNQRWDAVVPLNEIWGQQELLKYYPEIKIAKQELEGEIDDWGLFEKGVLLWCIENYVAQTCLRDKRNCLWLSYENLVSGAEKGIKKIFDFIGREYDDRVFDVFRNPSPTCRKESAILTGKDLINDWKNQVDKGNQVWVSLTAKTFGLKFHSE